MYMEYRVYTVVVVVLVLLLVLLLVRCFCHRVVDMGRVQSIDRSILLGEGHYHTSYVLLLYVHTC